MSQIIGKEMKGSYRRNHGVDWPDNDPQVEKEEDHIGPDGTDYVAKAQSDFEEGEESEGSRVADMLRRIKDKRGAAGMKAEEAEREEKDEEGEDEDKEESKDEGKGEGKGEGEYEGKNEAKSNKGGRR